MVVKGIFYVFMWNIGMIGIVVLVFDNLVLLVSFSVI